MFRRNVHCFRCQAFESTNGQKTPKTKAVRAFETCGSNRPTRRRTDPADRLQKMKSFSAVPFPATPVVLSAALCCLSLACYTSDKQVSCHYGRCTCRLTADLALQQISYTKCIQNKAILSGGGWGEKCRLSLFFNREGSNSLCFSGTSHTTVTDSTERGKQNPLSKYFVVTSNNFH